MSAYASEALDTEIEPRSRRAGRRSGWGHWLVLAVFALVFGSSLLYVTALPSEYSAQATVLFSPKPTANGGIVGNETTASTAAGYVSYLGAASTIQAVAESIGISPRELKDGLRIRQLPATTTIAIEFKSYDPASSAAGANAMAAAVVSRASNDPVATGALLSQAAEPLTPSGPPRTLFAITGLVLAIIVAGAVAFVIYRFDGPGSR